MEINKEELINIYEKLLTRTTDDIKKYFGADLISIILFGSMARGEIQKNSDIDLLIITENLPEERLKRQDIFMKLEGEINLEIKQIYEKWGFYPYISPILKTADEAKCLSPLYLDMVTDARIIYDRNNFFKNILEKLKIELELLNAMKKKVGKKWYWDLKPDYKPGDRIQIG